MALATSLFAVVCLILFGLNLLFGWRSRNAALKLRSLQLENQKLEKIQTTLLELTEQDGRGLDVTLQHYLAISAIKLNVSRVGMWQFDSATDLMTCNFLLRDLESISEQANDSVNDVPEYTRMMREGCEMTIDDTHVESCHLNLDYVIARNISASIDVPITINGKLIASIRYEHTGSARSWTDDEVQVARSTADLCALAFASEENRVATETLQESERLLDEARNIARLGSFIFHLESKQLILSNAYVDQVIKSEPINNIEKLAAYILEPAREEFFQDIEHLMAEVSYQQDATSVVKFKRVYPFRFSGRDVCHIEINAESVKTDTGYDLRGTMQDITPRVLAEQDNQQLQQRLLEAERLKTIGNLAKGVAHEFNNLLTPLIGFAQILSADFPEHDRRKGYSDQIANSGLRAKALVDQLLAFSVRNKKVYEPIDIAEVCAGSTAEIQKVVKATIEFQNHLDDQTQVAADPNQLHQVLLNLCHNADEAMASKGTIEIELCSENTRGSHPQILIRVTDTGPGIDAESLPHIFEPFFTTAETGQNSGLGLSVVHGILQQHHGDIHVDSEPGHTTFTLRLPIYQAEETALAISPQRSRF